MVLADIGRGVSLDYSQPVALQAGDTFSLLLLSEEKSWIYIIAQDSERNAIILHYGFLEANDLFSTNPIRLVPPGGQETIYVILSNVRETMLEAQIAAFQADASFRNGRNVINAVMELRRDILAIGEAPERPVQLGGSFRSFTNNDYMEGLSFSGAESISKPF